MKKWYFLSPLILQKLIWVPTHLALAAFGRLEVRGLENLEGLGSNVIFACNHTSELDPFMIPGALGFFSPFSPIFYTSREKRFYASSGWRKNLYGGAFFKAWGSYPVYVGLHDYEKSLVNHTRIIRDGGSLCIFPEGRKTPDGSIQPAKGGVGYLAYATGRPIVPVRIDGLYGFRAGGFLLGHRRLSIAFGEPLHVMNAPQTTLVVDDFKAYANFVMDRIRALGPEASIAHPSAVIPSPVSAPSTRAPSR